MDFTPGIFDLLLKRSTGQAHARRSEPRPRTTLAKQLALYVVLYSPLQMAADLPENYAGQPAFQFIRDVAVDWDTTRVIDGRDRRLRRGRAAGARSARPGSSARSPTRTARTFDVPLVFLTPGKRYVAEIYADGPGANWSTIRCPSRSRVAR